MKATLVLCLLLVCTAALAWAPIQVNEMKMVYHSGPVYWAVTPEASPVMAATTNRIPRTSMVIIHGTAPAGVGWIPALYFPPLAFQEFTAPCSGEDTVSFQLEIARAWAQDSIHWQRDFVRDAWAISPVIHIPFGGSVTRSFYSAEQRPQGNGWDDFVQFFNSGVLPGQPFVIRVVPCRGSGVALLHLVTPFQLLYTTNPEPDTVYIDEGPPGIRYMDHWTYWDYSGAVLRGKWTREFGRDMKLSVTGVAPNGVETYFRRIWVPFNEENTHGIFHFAIDMDVFGESYRFFMNDSLHPPCTARADSVAAIGKGELIWGR